MNCNDIIVIVNNKTWRNFCFRDVVVFVVGSKFLFLRMQFDQSLHNLFLCMRLDQSLNNPFAARSKFMQTLLRMRLDQSFNNPFAVGSKFKQPFFTHAVGSKFEQPFPYATWSSLF